MKQKFSKSRSFRYGGIAAAITAGFIVVVVLLNVLATALYERFPLGVDLTSDQKFTLSEDAAKYLADVDEDVVIYMLSPRDSYEAYDESSGVPLNRLPRIADEISKANNHIKVEYIDLDANPTFAQKYSEETLTQLHIIIESAKRHFTISVYDLFDIQTSATTGAQSVTGEKIELTLVSKILSCAMDTVPKVSFVTGHNEDTANLAAFKQLLSDNGYETNEISLGSDGIPEDTNFVVIAAPKLDYTAEELKVLDAFLAKDANNPTLMVTFSASYAPLNNFDAFLSEWGIKAGEGMLVETQQNRYFTNSPNIAIGNLGSSEYASSFASSQVPPVVANSKPIELLFTSKGNITTESVVTTSNTAQTVDTDGNPDETGTRSYDVLTVSKNTRYEGTTEFNANVVAVGSNDFFNASSIFSCINDDVIMKIYNSISGREGQDVAISTRTVSDTAISVTNTQAVWIGIVLFTVTVPLLLLIAGVVIWLRRRHL